MQKRKHSQNKRLLGIILATLLVIFIVTTLELLNVTHIFHKQAIPTTASQATKGEPTSSANGSKGGLNGSQSAAPASQPGDQKSDSGGAATVNILAPTGNFVSNHTPGQNGSPTEEASVCNTTPGASCQIIFTKDGITKSLSAQITDRGGATYWNNWTPKGIGLSVGEWKIEAIASLNGKTQSAVDAKKLVVSE